MANHLYFEQSHAAFKQITELYDFVWPTAVGIWNLRWQVTGYVTLRPEASVSDLEGRFVVGSDIRGANLRRACIETSWPEQQQQFAKFLLVDLCATFEGWIAATLDQLGVNTRSNEKDLQYPSTPSPASATRGVKAALARIASPPSSVVHASFYAQLCQHSKNSSRELEALLTCYRYFKECRNALSHGGGIADSSLLDAYAAFQQVASPPKLGLREVPNHVVPVLTQPVQLSLRGVVGLSDVLLHLIATLDAELACSKDAEKVLLRRWKSLPNGRQTVPRQGTSARTKRIQSIARKLRLPVPADTSHLDAWASSHGLFA